MAPFFIVFSILAVVVGGLFLVTDTTHFNPDGIEPGDSLYGLDQWMEGVRSRFANSDREKAEQALENASERLRELENATERNDTDGITEASEGFQRALTETVEHTYTITEPAARQAVTQATERLAEETRPVIENVTGRIEKETQEALAAALEGVQTELDTVFDRIKERAKEEVRQEMADLSERLKQELTNQLKMIGENITNNNQHNTDESDGSRQP